MKKKISGFTASGPARPEIRPDDIFKDKYGGTVTIKHVAGRCVTYRRDGYGYDCVMPVYQFTDTGHTTQTAHQQRKGTGKYSENEKHD